MNRSNSRKQPHHDHHIPQDVLREKHLSVLLGAFLPFQYNNTNSWEGLAYKLGFSIEEVNEVGKNGRVV